MFPEQIIQRQRTEPQMLHMLLLIVCVGRFWPLYLHHCSEQKSGITRLERCTVEINLYADNNIN